MRPEEFIRTLITLIDTVDIDGSGQPNSDVVDYETEQGTDDLDRMKEILDYANSPDERITSQSLILSMGNDLNKPKHPSDIRSDSMSMYPNMQYKPD